MKTIMLFLYSETEHAHGACADLACVYAASSFDVPNMLRALAADPSYRNKELWFPDFLDVLVIDHDVPGSLNERHRFELDQFDSQAHEIPGFPENSHAHSYLLQDQSKRRWIVVTP